MKVLFLMRHSGYIRNFEWTVRMLCARGHHVHLGFQGSVTYDRLDPLRIPRQLAAEYAGFSYGEARTRADGWGPLGRELRLGLDYLRYLEREYDDAPKLRERARREAPPHVRASAEGRLLGNPLGRRAMAARLRAMNRAIPRDPEIDRFLEVMKPDVLAVTPLIESGSPQSEYVRSARALGVPAVHCVASWDNLTNKGLIHGPVDLVAVWNEAMKREAVAMHGVPAGRVVVTGAAAFDHWFEWCPGATREEFCARIGLPSARPFLLYVCSSKFVAPEEVPFVRTWLTRLRESRSAVLGNIGVLIRPHPQNAEQWQDPDLAGLGPVAVWPRGGAAPADRETRGDYFDSIHHSAAVVGVNTTAEIESAIIGRGVYTLLAPEFRDTQEGTLHFRHLREVEGGLVSVARDFDEHWQQLEQAVADPASAADRCARFVRAFVRPHGIDVPATPRLVEALERVAASAVRRVPDPWWAPHVRRRMEGRRARVEHEWHQTATTKAQRRAAKAARHEERRALRRARLDEKVKRVQDRRAQASYEDRPTRSRSLEAFVVDFTAMPEEKRRAFLRGILESIPQESFADLLSAAPPGKLDYEQADIYMRATTGAERFRLRGCAKEPFTVAWIHEHVGAGDVLFDVGANVGVYSLVAAMKPGGGARVFSFEPSYVTVASLCVNIVLNGLGDQVTPLPLALSAGTGMTILSLRDVEPGSGRHTLGPDAAEDGSAVYRQPVLMFRLDDLVDSFGLPLPNHIKLDVDGGELAVLEGARRTLSSPALRSMLVEVSTALSGTVIELLEGCGLQLHSKVSVQNKAGEYAVWYGLFLRHTS